MTRSPQMIESLSNPGRFIPAFPEGVVVADPARKGRKGVVYFGHETSTSDLPSGGGTPSG